MERCTFTRQMKYLISDLAYVQDIEALDKKINVLAETSHSNDVSMASIQETFTTVDEVNEALGNYVLKSDYDAKIAELTQIIESLTDCITALEPVVFKLSDYYIGYAEAIVNEEHDYV